MTGWNPCSVPVWASIKWRPLGILGWSLVTVGMEPKQQSMALSESSSAGSLIFP